MDPYEPTLENNRDWEMERRIEKLVKDTQTTKKELERQHKMQEHIKGHEADEETSDSEHGIYKEKQNKSPRITKGRSRSTPLKTDHNFQPSFNLTNISENDEKSDNEHINNATINHNKNKPIIAYSSNENSSQNYKKNQQWITNISTTVTYKKDNILHIISTDCQPITPTTKLLSKLNAINLNKMKQKNAQLGQIIITPYGKYSIYSLCLKIKYNDAINIKDLQGG